MTGHLKYSIRTTVSGFFVFLILFSCGSDTPSAVAKVGTVSISEDEYQRRFNFNNVFPPEVPLSTQKEIVLSSLLAERVLSVYTNLDSLSTEIRIAREQTWRELLIEELRQDSVERQINITETELRNEYDKSLRDINIKYLAFNDSSEAWDLYHKAILPTGSFNSAALNYLAKAGQANESIPMRRIIWGNELADLEKEVYEMADGQTHVPFFVYDQYYVIYRDQSIANVSTTPQDYSTRRDAIQEKLFRQKVEKKYKEFYSRQIFPMLGRISWDRLQPIYDNLVANTRFSVEDEASQLPPQPLKKEVYLSRKEQISELLEKDAVRFSNGKTMSVEKVLERLAFGPYVFNYSSARNLKKSFFNMVHLMLEHEAVYTKALSSGYAKKQMIGRKMKGWDSYYFAVEKKQELAKSLAGNTLQETIDNFLIEKSKQVNIEIYPAVFENIELQPAGVLVRKSHYANRLVAAPVHNFMGLRSWEKYVKKLLVAAQS